MTTTRTLSNVGQPLVAPDGTPLAGVAVKFTLIGVKNKPVQAFDASTLEAVAGVVATETDDNGEFSVAIWPNARGNIATKYLCEIDYPGFPDVRSTIPEGSGTYTWAEFVVGDGELSPQEVTALAAHIANPTGAHAASAISFTATGSLASTNVQAALAELDSEKQPVDLDLTNIAGLSPANDDIIQRKGGAWTNRTVAQVAADLVLVGVLSASSTATLTNKSIDLASNTLTGTLAQFNAALSGADFASLAGVEALTNKTLNGLSVTTTTGTLTVANSKTLTASNTLTLSGNDGASLVFGAGGTLAYQGGTLAQFAATTSAQLAGVISDETGAGALVFGTSPTLATPVINGLPTGTGVATANTPSTLVARDGSGNFSAGTITANLTGLASNASQLLGSTWSVPQAIGATTPAAGTFTALRATGDMIVDGNLLVSGDTITVNTSTVSVEDPLVKYASANTTDAVDIGFYALYRPGATDLYTGFFRDATDGKYKLFSGLQGEPGTTVNIAGTGYTVATMVANLEGNVTGTTGTFTNLVGTLTTAAQPNVTSLGTIAALSAGTITASSTLVAGDKITATDFMAIKSGSTQIWHWGLDGSNNLVFTRTGTADRLRLNAAGGADVTGTFSVSGATTLAAVSATTVTASGSVFTGDELRFTSKTRILSPTDGTLSLVNNAGNANASLTIAGLSATTGAFSSTATANRLAASGDYASNGGDLTLTNTNGGRSWRIGDGIGGFVGQLVTWDATGGTALTKLSSSTFAITPAVTMASTLVVTGASSSSNQVYVDNANGRLVLETGAAANQLSSGTTGFGGWKAVKIKGGATGEMLVNDAGAAITGTLSATANTTITGGDSTTGSNITLGWEAAGGFIQTYSSKPLRLNPLGNDIWFGTHTPIGAETITGYITIKDSAGNTRKLAVVS